jgi:hypothetical protein
LIIQRKLIATERLPRRALNCCTALEGVKPIATIEDLAGDPAMTADLDVEEFLRQVREDRERSSTQSME